MFTQLKNIDRAFQHIKRFSITFLVACVLLSASIIYLCFDQMNKASGRVLILYNGKVLEAFASERKQNLNVELKDHIKTFHRYFLPLILMKRQLQLVWVKLYTWQTIRQSRLMII